MNKEIKLRIAGLGIIMYSDFAVKHIAEGEDYFSANYQMPQQVDKHIHDGTIVGFCTSSPGDYILKIKEGYPEDSGLANYEFKLRLGIKVEDGKICFRDLYDLMDWRSACPESQAIQLENGFYNITLCGDVPSSGIIGDNQVIELFLSKVSQMPVIDSRGVPIYSE